MVTVMYRQQKTNEQQEVVLELAEQRSAEATGKFVIDRKVIPTRLLGIYGYTTPYSIRRHNQSIYPMLEEIEFRMGSDYAKAAEDAYWNMIARARAVGMRVRLEVVFGASLKERNGKPYSKENPYSIFRRFQKGIYIGGGETCVNRFLKRLREREKSKSNP